jgi:hypothetical protein
LKVGSAERRDALEDECFGRWHNFCCFLAGGLFPFGVPWVGVFLGSDRFSSFGSISER